KGLMNTYLWRPPDEKPETALTTASAVASVTAAAAALLAPPPLMRTNASQRRCRVDAAAITATTAARCINSNPPYNGLPPAIANDGVRSLTLPGAVRMQRLPTIPTASSEATDSRGNTAVLMTAVAALGMVRNPAPAASGSTDGGPHAAAAGGHATAGGAPPPPSPGAAMGMAAVKNSVGGFSQVRSSINGVTACCSTCANNWDARSRDLEDLLLPNGDDDYVV
ncbi:hypothetical protein Vretimale_10452, partial [Volvox reticuliferus]